MICSGKRNRGSILVFVLAMITLLSVLSLSLMRANLDQLMHVKQFSKRDDLRIHAYSALDLASGVLEEFKLVEGKLWSPAQGWGDPLAYSEVSPLDPKVKWSIKLMDESAKMPIDKVNPKDMTALFALMTSEEESTVEEDDGAALSWAAEVA